MNDNYEQYVLVLGVMQCIHFRVGVDETDGGRSLAPIVLEESLRVNPGNFERLPFISLQIS